MAKNCETIVSFPILVQTSLSALVICFTGYKVRSVSFLLQKSRIPIINLFQMSILVTPGAYLQYVDYALIMALQIYLPCYYGNEITINSSNLNNTLYHSNWIDFDIKTKKTMCIYMEFLKRPVVLKAGNFFYIGLRVFTRVMNNSYSLFALMSNMSD